jgi:hypothetical protein
MKTSLLNQVSGEPVAVRPEGALRANFAIGIVDAFFVRAAQNPFGADYRFNSMRVEQLQDLSKNCPIGSSALFGKQPHHLGIGPLGFHDADRSLGRVLVIGSVVDQGCYRIPAESARALSLAAAIRSGV